MIAADEVLSRVWGMLIGRERAPLAQILPRRPTALLISCASGRLRVESIMLEPELRPN